MKAVLLNRILLVLAFLGLFVAGVLSAGHALNIQIPCGGSDDCATVAAHPASQVAGIPIAYFGFGAYLVLALLAMMRVWGGNTSKLVYAGYGVSVIGTIISLYLQYQSFMVIKATCLWCLTSAIIMVLTLILHAFLAQSIEKEGSAVKGGKLDSILCIGLPIALVLALGVQVVEMRSGGGSAPKLADGTTLPDDLKDILLKDAHTIGPKNAKVTVVEFADLQCGACQTRSPAVKAFAEQYPAQMQFAYRHFPLTDNHKWAAPSAALAEYAAEKGKFWEFIMEVMALQREIESADELYMIAKGVGLDMEDAKKRVTNPDDEVYARVARDMELADRFGIKFTPTFFVFAEGYPVEIADSGNIFDVLGSKKYEHLLNAK